MKMKRNRTTLCLIEGAIESTKRCCHLVLFITYFITSHFQSSKNTYFALLGNSVLLKNRVALDK